jgi:hypothetical protein
MADLPRERIDALISIYDQRRGTYGEDYTHIGESMIGMFPNGLNLVSERDFTRFALLCSIHGKLLRYAARFKDNGHADSLDDISIYAQLLRSVDSTPEKKE